MAKLDEMHKIYDMYCSGSNAIARLVTIYIEESCAGKGLNSAKPIGDHHRTIEDRITAANRFVKETGWYAGEVVIDTMANEILDRYDAHPERVVIILKGRVVHDGGNGPVLMVHYDIDDVLKWLKKCDARAPADGVFTPESQSDVEEEEVCAA